MFCQSNTIHWRLSHKHSTPHFQWLRSHSWGIVRGVNCEIVRLGRRSLNGKSLPGLLQMTHDALFFPFISEHDSLRRHCERLNWLPATPRRNARRTRQKPVFWYKILFLTFTYLHQLCGHLRHTVKGSAGGGNESKLWNLKRTDWMNWYWF